IVACARPPGGPPGDPCLPRLRGAVQGGAVPFTCQGSENGLAIEGGETLALEMITRHAALAPRPIDRLLIQVGGGALASACLLAFAEAWPRVPLPRIHAVQTKSAQPLERAWRSVASAILARFAARESGGPGPGDGDAAAAAFVAARAGAAEVEDELARAARFRARHMRPWESEPVSVATGILDDETYDWLAVVRGMVASGGWPVAVSEERLLAARALARSATGIHVDATGAAGLAGLLALRAAGALAPHENVALLFTGAAR
ncbi:MAG: pyridoxal-phosphate dependent enzyme, partial [Planctomycetes bacterium]|nr:pyridoxal-phosphate dependent enzyme [Planctomycetota bacterium]